MTCQLYCIRFDAPVEPIAKVGVTKDIRSRFPGLTQAAPYPATLTHLFSFATEDDAKSWEHRILRLATRYRDQGEWVLADDRLAELLDQVRGGEDLTEHFATTYRGRVLAVDRPHRKARRNGIGDISAFRKAVRSRIADGFGVEDISVKDGFDVELVRAEVQRLRARGEFKRRAAA